MQLRFEFRSPAIVCAGARAAEERLIEEVARLRDEARRDPALLARPVYIVVPSKPLRRQVSARLVARLGPHLLGLRVDTLHGLARALAGSHGEDDPNDLLEPVLALRNARAEPALAALLADYEDAHGPLVSSIRELLEAGLRPVHADAALEALGEAADLAPGEGERAAALVRAACRSAPLLEQLGISTSARVLERAAARLGRPGAGLGARAVLLHGFADATGLVADLLEQLAGLPGSRFVAVLPPDPASPRSVDASARHGARLRERVKATGEPTAWTPEATLRCVVADGEELEALEVARRVAALLDAGVVPERIGVVGAQLASRAAALRHHFDRLGIPWSATVDGPATPLARWRRLVDLLRLGPRTPTDRWLDLLGALPIGEERLPIDPSLRASLRLALRALGAARLSDALQVDVEARLAGEAALRLPGGSGLDEARVAPRSLPAPQLRGLFAAIQAFCAAWAALPATARPAGWRAALMQLLTGPLAQPADHPAVTALARLDEIAPLTLDREELPPVLDALLRGIGSAPFGGAGAGVQLMEVRDARGLVFDHLFLLGNNRRGGAPRDAVLGDPVRRALRAVLPDLPLRADRFDEDRFHFAWLLSAAPAVSLSWLSVDSRGKPVSVSPLVERLRWAGRWEKAERVAAAWTLPSGRSTARERAVASALAGGPEAMFPDLAEATSPALARAQVASLLARDARAGFSPWHGWIGPLVAADDLRRRPAAITTVENFASCPWETLLNRQLKVEPVPDPLAEVPQADARLAGILVHRVLEAVVRGAGRGRIASAAGREPIFAPWPEDVGLLARQLARELLAEEGVLLPGLAELLAIRVAPLLDAARAADWAQGSPAVVGAEVEGALRVDGRGVYLRADRVDLAHGVLSLTDYKTGRSFADLASPEKRRDKLLARVRAGKSLQAAAYAWADGVTRASGRLLFLGPDVEHRSLRVSADDEGLRAALEGAVRTVLDAMEVGAFFPRVIEPDKDREPNRCRSCKVAEACVRGESGDRDRLRRAAEATAGASGAAERAFHAAWTLWSDA